MKTEAIIIQQTGGPEVLQWRDWDLREPGKGEVLLRHTAIGLNFIDTYFRSGLYPLAALPTVLGNEAAGVVEAVGEAVSDLAVGDRVAYASGMGAYARHRIHKAAELVKLPDGISDETAAALLLKGMTVQYLFKSSYSVQQGEPILFHAAAGGVGLIACQWARALGVRLIGTVGSDAKAALAQAAGAAEMINYEAEDFVARTQQLTDQEGVPVVYDSVGQRTFLPSLDCLRVRGTLVSFGQSSGPVAPLDIGLLNQKGSLYVQRPSLFAHIATKAALNRVAGDLFAQVQSGAIEANIGQRFPLEEAAEAQRALEARATQGATILLP